jgi:D-sedoheptulose 7-phosphate isomerase
MLFPDYFLDKFRCALNEINREDIEHIAKILANIRKKDGRVFVLGVGGSAASGSHLVNDLRKIASIEAYAPTDNVSELSARTNDDGWTSVFEAWLKASRFNNKDCIFVFSVGGGNKEMDISGNIVAAIEYAKKKGASIVGVIGRDGGHTRQQADASVLVPTVDTELITPITESMHSLVGHLLVSHPLLKSGQTKWESLA